MQYTPHKCLIFLSGCYWYSQGRVLKQSVDIRDCSFLCKQSWCWYSCNKASPHCEGGWKRFSHRQLSLFAKNREAIISNPSPVCGLRWLINCWDHRCLNPCNGGRIWLPKEAAWGRFKPGGGCTAWVRGGGKNSDYRVGEKVTKELEETISSFSSFVCTGRINFFPTVRVFFHADWSTAGLSQQLDSEERRAR